MNLEKYHGLGNDFLILLDFDVAPSGRRGHGARPV